MTPDVKFMVRSFRNYLQLIGEEYEEREWGDWDDVDRPGNTDHVARPDGLAGLMAEPFVLIETSHYGQTWITLHADPDAAVEYHAGQEYAEDWRIDRLTDCRDMTEYRMSAKAVKT
jgi:hypothetical protein